MPLSTMHPAFIKNPWVYVTPFVPNASTTSSIAFPQFSHIKYIIRQGSLGRDRISHALIAPLFSDNPYSSQTTSNQASIPNDLCWSPQGWLVGHASNPFTKWVTSHMKEKDKRTSTCGIGSREGGRGWCGYIVINIRPLKPQALYCVPAALSKQVFDPTPFGHIVQ